MERCVADPPITDAERMRRQGCRLRQLRERTGASKGRIMDALGLTTTNGYDLYERGVSVIRFDRVDDWAAAFGIAPLDFAGIILGERTLDEVLPLEPEDWDMTEALRGHVPERDIPGFVAEHAGKDITDQKAIAQAIIELTRLAQRRGTRRNRAG